MELYPVFLHLRGRPVLLVGGGKVASAQARRAALRRRPRHGGRAAARSPPAARTGVERFAARLRARRSRREVVRGGRRAPGGEPGSWRAPPRSGACSSTPSTTPTPRARTWAAWSARRGVTLAVSTRRPRAGARGAAARGAGGRAARRSRAWVDVAQDLRAQWKAAGVPMPRSPAAAACAPSTSSTREVA